ncbi:MAG TPA: hypothetical protein VJT71_05390 [Pyrinomonadaceae bacterium]|nr:hypothetical protein [Pyrinomonadaceae bacterium]
MSSRRLHRFLFLAVGAVACLLVFSDSALAQCAMCRGSFGGNSAFARNLNIGVLVLLAPPVSIFVTIFVIAFRHRKG